MFLFFLDFRALHIPANIPALHIPANFHYFFVLKERKKLGKWERKINEEMNGWINN